MSRCACGFALKIPPALRGAPSKAEEDFDFLAAWREDKSTPQRVFRLTISGAMRRADLEAIRPFTIPWSTLTTGFPTALETSPGLERCPRCRLRRFRVGSFRTSPRGEVVVERCPCGTGLARWEHYPPVEEVGAHAHGPHAEGPYVVGMYVPGPGRDGVSTLVQCQHPDDPLPPHAFVLVDGRLAGQLTVLAGEILFTNRLSLARVDTDTIPLDREQFERLRGVIQRSGRALLRRFEAARTVLAREL